MGFFDKFKKQKPETENKQVQTSTQRQPAYQDNKTELDLSSTEKIAAYLLNGGMHGLFATEDITEGDHILLPEWNVRIYPFVENSGTVPNAFLLTLGFHIYAQLVYSSSIYNVIQQLKEKGSDPKSCRLTTLLFNINDQFEVR